MTDRRLNDATPEEWDDAFNALQQHIDMKSSKPTDWVNTATFVPKASEKQVGGNHYKKFMIQPAEFCYYNNIPYLEATAIKYLCRWKDKGGIQDLEKAKHFIDLLIEFQDANN